MKPIIVSCVMLAIGSVALAGQTRPYGVTVVSVEKAANFAGFKTYSWAPGRPSSIKEIDTQIVAAADRELATLGLTKAKSGPGDVLISYASLSRTDVDMKAKPDEKGVRPQYSVGTLELVWLEPGTLRRLLQLRVDTPIEADAAQLEATINRAVGEMFLKYPTRPQK